MSKDIIHRSAWDRIKSIFKPIDLSKGTPWKVILLFWVPVVLSYLFQQSYTLIDELICGHYLEAAYVTGIDDTNSLTFLVLQFAFGCSAGFSVVSGAKKGENDMDGLRKSFVTQMLLALVVSIVLTIVAVLCVDPLLDLLNINEANTRGASKIFITTIYAGLFTQVFYNLICAFLRSIGDSLTPFLFLFGSTVLSVGLDFLFIAGIGNKMPDFGLAGAGGVFGAAMSVNIAQFLAAAGCIAYALWRYPFIRPKKSDFKIDWKFTLEHLKLGLPLAFQFSILAIGLIVLQSNVVDFDTFSQKYYSKTGNYYKDIFGITYSPIHENNGTLSFNMAQAAFGPSNKFETFLETTLDALGATMISYCSQNRGARKYDRIKLGLKQATYIALIICTCIMLIELLASINGAYLYLFLAKNYVTDAVKHYGQMYFYFVAPTTYILGLLFIYRSSVQGLGKSLFPLMAGIMEVIARVLVSLFVPTIMANLTGKNALTAVYGPHYGWSYLSVCIAHPAAWILACIPCLIGLVYYVFQGKLEKIDKKKYGDGPIL